MVFPFVIYIVLSWFVNGLFVLSLEKTVIPDNRDKVYLGGFTMSTKGFGRVDRDAFFTPRETSQKIVDYLLEEYPEWRGLEWVEPSAGDGSFIDACENRGVSIIGYDLDPQREDIIQSDFLNFDDSLDLGGKIVIGNPPYGKRNKLTIDFINRAFGLGAEKIAFLVMSSMMNVSYLKKINRMIDLVKFIDTDFFVGAKREIVGFEFALIVFDKEEDDRDWSKLSYNPYCRGIKYGEKFSDNYIVAGFNHYDFIENVVDDIVEYDRGGDCYKIGKKVYKMYEFFDTDFFKEEKVFINNIFRKINITSNRPTSSTINYWLLPENRVKVDWEPL